MSESYTHYLIAESKEYRPTPQSVGQFLDRVIQTHAIGDDYHIDCAGVVKVEPQFRKVRKFFTTKMEKIRTPPRKRSMREQVPTTSRAVALTEQEQEFDISVASTLPPTNPPLDIGCADDNGTWQSWTEPYHLRICCSVRKSPVRLCLFKPGDAPNAPLTNIADFITNITPQFDEDCAEDEKDGLFVHPEAPDGIVIPNAGCGTFWVEFEYGKWLYPRLKDDSLALLNPVVIEWATEAFGTHFIEACSWG
jgi:hypothetical protein